MKVLSALVRLIKWPWFWSVIGVILACLLVWYVLRYVPIGDSYPLEDLTNRLIAVLVILVIFIIVVFVSLVRAQRRNSMIVEELDTAADAQASAEEAELSAQEVLTLRDRMRQAMVLLKKAKFGRGFGRRYLYQLPWYMLIGPPGSGKTTALVKSGLRFVLQDQLGNEAVRGVGGTRNCDWWFTDEAVLIDTAGRYTTQDARAGVDQAAWGGFLDLLRRNRPRRPINGVFIVFAINEVMAMSEEERAEHAGIIRARINELHARFKLRFPIYVLFTKCDLIAGFIEFFDELGREERQQVWGMTFPLGNNDRAAEGTAATFNREYDLLMERLNDRLLDKVHRQIDVQRRALIYGFPSQMASLRDLLQDFLDAVFRPSQFEEKPLLRGVYFTSGTQEGTPIDRMMGALATRFGVSRSALPAFSGGGRSYFVTRLLRNVAFPEAELASVEPAREKRRVWVRRTGYATLALLTLAVLGGWTWSYFNNMELVEEAEEGVERYNAGLADVETEAVSDTDFAKVSPLLDIVRGLPGAVGDPLDDPPLEYTFGLYQGEKLGTAANASYRRALNNLLAPRLFLHLEDKIRDNLDNEENLYRYMRAYLMLGGRGTLVPDQIERLMQSDWADLYPGDDNATLRSHLQTHLDALLNDPLGLSFNFTLDEGLVQAARPNLDLTGLAGATYDSIRGSAAARNIREWRISDNAGASPERVLVRRSGATLRSGIEGFYTYEGFHNVLLPALDRIAQEIAAESFVFIDDAPDATTQALLDGFKDDVIGLYVDDYVFKWDQLLNDVAVRPITNLDDARDVLNVLSGAGSPLKEFLTSVANQTMLVRPAPAPADGASGDGAAAGNGAADGSGDGSGDAGGGDGIPGVSQPAANAAPQPGQFVNDQFEDLHDMVFGADGQPPGIDDVLSDMRAVYQGLNAAARAGGSTIPAELTQALQQLDSSSAALPEPVAGLVAEVIAGSESASAGGARSDLRDSYLTTIKPECDAAIGGRYPFEATAPADVTLDDFARIFGPGQLLDKFFTESLAPHADISVSPWKWKEGTVSLGLSSAALAQFERAATIRDVFFGSSATPLVKFTLLPVELSQTANRVLLTIDGQPQFSYSHGPQIPADYQWPGPDGPAGVNLSFTPSLEGQPNGTTVEGPWAWFHVLEGTTTATAQPEKVNATLTVGERSVTFEVTAATVRNPFLLPELKDFRCPTTL